MLYFVTCFSRKRRKRKSSTLTPLLYPECQKGPTLHFAACPNGCLHVQSNASFARSLPTIASSFTLHSRHTKVYCILFFCALLHSCIATCPNLFRRSTLGADLRAIWRRKRFKDISGRHFRPKSRPSCTLERYLNTLGADLRAIWRRRHFKDSFSSTRGRCSNMAPEPPQIAESVDNVAGTHLALRSVSQWLLARTKQCVFRT